MNGIVIVNEFANDIHGRIVLIVCHILTIKQRLISRRRRRRYRIDWLECILEHDRVSVLGRKLDRKLERLFADARLGIVRLPIKLEHSKVRCNDRSLFELFHVLFGIRYKQVAEQTLLVGRHEFVQKRIKIGQEVKLAFFVDRLSSY